MTRLVIDIDKSSDLEALLLFLNRLNIKFNQNVNFYTLVESSSIEQKGYLPIETIQKLYPNEWVLLASPQKDGLKIKGGTILVHHADKREMALQGRDLIAKYESVTHVYTGEFPKRTRMGILKLKKNNT